jgi:hypothetical protein
MTTPTITAAQLRGAAVLISDPTCWCRGHSAEDATGNYVAVSDPLAVRWCATGAIFAVIGPRGSIATEDIFDYLRSLDPNREALMRINDNQGRLAAVAELHRLADLAAAREGAAR